MSGWPTNDEWNEFMIKVDKAGILKPEQRQSLVDEYAAGDKGKTYLERGCANLKDCMKKVVNKTLSYPYGPEWSPVEWAMILVGLRLAGEGGARRRNKTKNRRNKKRQTRRR
jgi:hypothetical protein